MRNVSADSIELILDWLSLAPGADHARSVTSRWLSLYFFTVLFLNDFLQISASPSHVRAYSWLTRWQHRLPDDSCSNCKSPADRARPGARNDFYWEQIRRISPFFEYIWHRIHYLIAENIQESVITSKARVKFKYFARQNRKDLLTYFSCFSLFLSLSLSVARTLFCSLSFFVDCFTTKTRARFPIYSLGGLCFYVILVFFFQFLTTNNHHHRELVSSSIEKYVDREGEKQTDVSRIEKKKKYENNLRHFD